MEMWMLSQLVRQSILGFKAALKKKENASRRKKSKAWKERGFIKSTCTLTANFKKNFYLLWNKEIYVKELSVNRTIYYYHYYIVVQLPCTYIYVEEIWVPISRTNTLKIIFLRQWFYITIIMSDEVMVILGIRAGWSIKISVSTHFQTLFDKTSNIWHRIWRWNQSGKFKPFNELSL